MCWLQCIKKIKNKKNSIGPGNSPLLWLVNFIVLEGTMEVTGEKRHQEINPVLDCKCKNSYPPDKMYSLGQ